MLLPGHPGDMNEIFRLTGLLWPWTASWPLHKNSSGCTEGLKILRLWHEFKILPILAALCHIYLVQYTPKNCPCINLISEMSVLPHEWNFFRNLWTRGVKKHQQKGPILLRTTYFKVSINQLKLLLPKALHRIYIIENLLLILSKRIGGEIYICYRN